MTTPSVALVTAPVSLQQRYGSYTAAANTQPSFGLLSLASSAMKSGARVRVIEAAARNMDAAAAAKAVLSSETDLLGISSTTIGVPAAAQLAEMVKADSPSTITVLGGCHISALPEPAMTDYPQFDVGVIGEGEATLVDILQALPGGIASLAGIPGTIVRRGEQVERGPARQPIEQLDSLPPPAWQLLDGFPNDFRPSPARIMRWPCASVVLTRGCPNTCTFCDRSVFGRACRSYSPAYAAEMCHDLSTRFGVRELLIEDDTFIISKKNVAGFCEELLKRKINISWSCLGRADRIDQELLKLMRRAGCWHISFGIESGDEEILKAVHKNLTMVQIEDALNMCRRAGIRTKGFFMVGFPGESQKSIEATRSAVRKLPLDDISVMHLTPFPGSELYEQAESLGTFDSSWKAMNALTPVFIPHGMTVASLEEARDTLLRAFFSKPDVIWRHALRAIRHPRLLRYYTAGAFSLLKTTGKKNHAS